MRVKKGFIRQKELETAVDSWVALGKTGRQVRAIVIDLPGGEREILITNLSEDEMEYRAFAEMYPNRWGIRRKYKTVKQKL
jgi:hypothetical protein